MFGASGTPQHIKPPALQPPAWFDPQVQLQRAIDALDPLVVPRMSFHVAQVQETQANTPCLENIGQSDQQIGELFVLVLQLRTVARAVSLALKARQASAVLAL